MVFVPNDDGNSFDFPDPEDIPTSLYVEGTSSPPQSAGDAAAPSRTAANQVVTAVLPDQGASAALAAEQPHFRKNVPQQCNVNIVRAELEWCLSGKPKFTPLEQLFITVTDASANINYILSVVQRKWGGDQVLVTGRDGLKIEDSSGTQGIQYSK